jgi:hypothetical protein
MSAPCPLWVKSGHRGSSVRCPLCPQKRTSIERPGMSGLTRFDTASPRPVPPGDSDCGDPSPARYVSQRAHHCAGVVAPFRTPRHMQIDYRTGRLVGISRHAHIYENTAIIATALDINARLCVLGQRCRCLVPAGWGEAHLKSRYTSIARSFIRLITRIGIAVDKLVVRFCA